MESTSNSTVAATMTAELQNTLTPQIAVDMLKQGNRRFLDQQFLERNYLDQVRKTASGQYPIAAIVSCIDSRVPAETIFDQGIGDIFSVRIAGNFINEDILGSLEFSCKLAGAKVIVVLGHTSCGAVKGACDHAELGNLTQMLHKIKPAVDAIETAPGVDRSSGNIDFVNEVAWENVRQSVAAIKSQSDVLREMLEESEIDILGAMYDVKTGKVIFESNNMA